MTFLKHLVVAALACLLAGCMNLYVRNPITDIRINGTYQSTGDMYLLSMVTAFPQCMRLSGGSDFEWYNIFTIPLGIVVFADDCCEAVVDTVCYPFDVTRQPENKR